MHVSYAAFGLFLHACTHKQDTHPHACTHHTYTSTHAHTYNHACTHANSHTIKYTPTPTHARTRTHTHIHTYIHVHTYTYSHTQTHTYTLACACAYIKPSVAHVPGYPGTCTTLKCPAGGSPRRNNRHGRSYFKRNMETHPSRSRSAGRTDLPTLTEKPTSCSQTCRSSTLPHLH